MKADGAGPLRLAASAIQQTSTWLLGDTHLEALSGGLETDAVHEFKPAASGDWSAAAASVRRFAAGLAIRRLVASGIECAEQTRLRPVLWCLSASRAREAGRLYGRGLAHLGLDPSCIVLVETQRESDVLWAVEEGLKSGALALVVAELRDAGLTPARRLALAAASARTPCLLLTDTATDGAASTANRWRIAPLVSAPHPFDPRAPGAPRWRIEVERCRARPGTAGTSLALEWRDGDPPAFQAVQGAQRSFNNADMPAKAFSRPSAFRLRSAG